MCVRQVVLLTPARSSHPRPLLSRQYIAPVSPLAATLTNSPVGVVNKRLTAKLTPLAATLTKNRGGAAPPFDVATVAQPTTPGGFPAPKKKGRGPSPPACPAPFQLLSNSFANFGLTTRGLSDRPWPAFRRSWLVPLRRHRVSACGGIWSGSGPCRRRVPCTRTDRRWCARPSHRLARN
jgi:hypothetical protein